MIVALFGLAGMAQAQVVSNPTPTVQGRAPTITATDIQGTGSGSGGAYRAGDVLTATYTQGDPDLDPADTAATNATIQWYSDAAPVGTLGSTTYQIQPSDLGKQITFRLVPHTSAADTDPSVGVETTSNLVAGSDGEGDGVVTIPSGSTATSVAITGNAIVGQTLTATPTCDAACDPAITYQWQIEDGIGSGNFVDIAGQTSATYVVVRTDQRKTIRVRAVNP